MRQSLLLLFLLSAMTLSAEESLKREVTALLGKVIEKSEGVPKGLTAEELYQEMSEDLDFSLNAEQAKQLAGGKALHADAERAELLKQCDQLERFRSPLSDTPLISTLKSAQADARDREAAYKLLEVFNEQKVIRLRFMNLNRARQLHLQQMDGRAALEQDESVMFEGLNGKQEWLFNPKGFGELEKGADLRQVIIMSPEPLMGKLVMMCKDGSGHIKTVEEVKDVIDLAKVKIPEANP